MSLKGGRHDISSKFSNFIILFLMYRLTNKGIVNTSKFASQRLSYKQDTDHDILWFVKKAKVLLWFIYALYC